MAVSRARAAFEAMAGRFDEARAMIARGKALATEIGDQVAVAALLREAGAVELRASDPAAAERELRAAYEILDSLQDIGHLSSAAPDLGEALVELGRADEALRISEYTETISIEGDVDANVRWRQLRARALARLGRHDEAEAFALEAVRLIAATDYLDLHANALMALAEVMRLAGRTSEAAEAVREAIELYRRKENVIGERRAQAVVIELDA
jgi:tetratricopeptide (TPR) repeat protein